MFLLPGSQRIFCGCEGSDEISVAPDGSAPINVRPIESSHSAPSHSCDSSDQNACVNSLFSIATDGAVVGAVEVGADEVRREVDVSPLLDVGVPLRLFVRSEWYFCCILKDAMIFGVLSIW